MTRERQRIELLKRCARLTRQLMRQIVEDNTMMMATGKHYARHLLEEGDSPARRDYLRLQRLLHDIEDVT